MINNEDNKEPEINISKEQTEFILISKDTSIVPIDNYLIATDIDLLQNTATYDITTVTQNPYKNPYIQGHKPKRAFGIMAIALLVIFGSFSIGAGIGLSIFFANAFLGTTTQTDMVQINYGHELLLSALHEPVNMSYAVERVKPAVVTIDAISEVASSPLPFFGNNSAERPNSGTGIIFDQNDDQVFIVTNEHVINQSDLIRVSVNNRAGVYASVVGRDIRSDIAVIYINKSDLRRVGVNNVTLAEFGNSADMRIGEFVFAIGNALGQGISTTMGVVSAQNIQISVENRLLSVIQTDAAINPGNSGGPLINTRGQVIGINTVKLSRPDVYGMGYSVTSDIALPIMQDILNYGGRPLIGIIGHNLTVDASEDMGIENRMGVVIQSVTRRSGAYVAGLLPGDIITHFDGTAVSNMAALIDLIGTKSMGDTINLTIVRTINETIMIELTLIPF